MSILVVSPIEGDRSAITRVLKSPAWEVKFATCYEEAQEILGHNAVEVVVCAGTLPDADWTRFQVDFPASQTPPLLVLADAGDLTLQEVLESGGHDLLTRPLDAATVLSKMRLASLSFRFRCSWNEKTACSRAD